MIGELDLNLDFFYKEVEGQERGNSAPLDYTLCFGGAFTGEDTWMGGGNGGL